MASKDALWAILPERRGGWTLEQFMESGVREIEGVLDEMDGLGLRPRRGRALDFGCGVGRLTQALADQFEEVVGVDISLRMLELADRYNQCPDRCRYQHNPATDLAAFEGGSFDYVYCSLVLMHIEPVHARTYVTEFLRLLRPGGVLVFQLPTRYPRIRRFLKGLAGRRLLAVYRRWRFGTGPLPDMNVMRTREVRELVRQAGGDLVATRANRFWLLRPWGSNRYYVVRPS